MAVSSYVYKGLNFKGCTIAGSALFALPLLITPNDCLSIQATSGGFVSQQHLNETFEPGSETKIFFIFFEKSYYVNIFYDCWTQRLHEVPVELHRRSHTIR